MVLGAIGTKYFLFFVSPNISQYFLFIFKIVIKNKFNSVYTRAYNTNHLHHDRMCPFVVSYMVSIRSLIHGTDTTIRVFGFL